jgi:prephenate dehydrogenase
MRTLGLLGTGLLGASIGLRARERGYHVIGQDISPEALAIARERGAIADAVSKEQLYTCDIVTLALPVDGIVAELERLHLNDQERAVRLIIDVGSTKRKIAELGASIKNFVPSHPFAGRERSGAAAADSTLFDGKSWVYVSSGDPSLDTRAEEFIREMGSIPYAVDPVAHDAICAATSHVPQLLAWLFAERYAEEDPQLIESLSGPVARELQRIARSERPMWREIFRANAENIAREAREISAKLERAATMLERGEEII